jgi:hypothetical protein
VTPIAIHQLYHVVEILSVGRYISMFMKYTLAVMLSCFLIIFWGCSRSGYEEETILNRTEQKLLIDTNIQRDSKERKCATILRFISNEASYYDREYQLEVRIDWSGQSRLIPVTIKAPRTDVCFEDMIPYGERLMIHFYVDRDSSPTGPFTRGSWLFKSQPERECTENGSMVLLLPLSNFMDWDSFSGTILGPP